MKKYEILEMATKEVRMYIQDTIPYDHLLLDENLEKFRSAFGFSKFEVGMPTIEGAMQKRLIFTHGTLVKDDKSIIVLSVQFDDRRIIIQTKGDSIDTQHVFDKICDYFNAIDVGKLFNPNKIVVKTYETRSVVKLNIGFYDFLSPRIKKFIKNIKKEERHTISEIAPIKFQFLITFKQDQDLFDKSNVYISSKTFVLEPRQGHHYSENIYFYQTPTDSTKHIQLLKELLELYAK